MNKKILASLVIIGILGFALGLGTYAYFFDTADSTGNTFTAGTLDLQVRDSDEGWGDSVSGTWCTPSNWAPGEYFEAWIEMRNIGSIGVTHIRVRGTNLEESVDGFADHIFLKTVIYSEYWNYSSNTPGTTRNEYNITNAIIQYYGMDTNNDGKISLKEFITWCNTYSMLFFEGPWESGEPYLNPGGAKPQVLRLGFLFDPEAGNDFQGATASFDLQIWAAQSYEQTTPSWVWPEGSYGYS